MHQSTLPHVSVAVSSARTRAYAARTGYDAHLRFFEEMRAAGDRGPVSEFWAARDLGVAGARLSAALDALDELGDSAGFHAGFESAAALRALIEAAG